MKTFIKNLLAGLCCLLFVGSIHAQATYPIFGRIGGLSVRFYRIDTDQSFRAAIFNEDQIPDCNFDNQPWNHRLKDITAIEIDSYSYLYYRTDTRILYDRIGSNVFNGANASTNGAKLTLKAAGATVIGSNFTADPGSQPEIK
jgi:hypothetical protein